MELDEHRHIGQRASTIVAELARIRGHIRALSDDIWLAIDHNDATALDEGVAFKRDYNRSMAAFDTATAGLVLLLQRFATDDAEDGGAPPGGHVVDPTQPHSIDEEFTSKRPGRLVLAGETVGGLTTWIGAYRAVIAILARRDPLRYADLPNDPRFISRRGSPDFARHPDALRIPADLGDGLFIETNLSTASITLRIGRLLDAFGIPRDQLTIYLR